MILKEKNKYTMNNISRGVLLILLLAIYTTSQLYAEEYRYGNAKSSSNLKQTAADCPPASAFDWLDINNVRARINTGGDMWWDLDGISRYYVPKAGSATSIFSGALWIGGLDINNQLKLAAQRFRQVGIDFWTGPLKVDGTASIDEATCAEYDQFFKMNRALIDEYTQYVDFENRTFSPASDYVIPNEILNWPAHGDVALGQTYYLAPFYDLNGDGEYDPENGDFPYYDIENELCRTDIPTAEEEFEGTLQGSILADQVIKGDQTLWWVFNDKGGVHSETSGAAIGLEIRAQAFAFATNDVINNMTFYSYEIINRSTFELTQTYFSPWIDTDLGYARDDFVGCDVQRGLGYCYNGRDIDGSGQVEAYGEQPPAVGVDFFQGPYMDPDNYDNPGYGGTGDGPRFVDDPTTPDIDERCEIVSKNNVILSMPLPDGSSVETRVESAGINGVNFGNGIIDDERFGMRRFVYHNNSSGNQGDPQIAPEYYNYLRGIWKDGTSMLYGGTAHYSGAGTVGPECDFMFPFDTDPCNWGTRGVPPNGGWNANGNYWSEETGNNGQPNPPEDRRFMQSAGPFTLLPGAVNYITVGIPWARAQSGGAFASVELLRVVDDKCQALFDNCFKVIDGPTAPDLTIREMDRKFIFYISNSPNSNNYQEGYEEFDPNIIQPLPGSETSEEGPVPSDPYYRFEGYQIFQVTSDEVGPDELNNPDKARLIAQFDVKNGVSKLVNYNFDDEIGGNVPVIEVVGNDNGISHSFVVQQDAFATGDVQLINNKHYYYFALAYAYNNYLDFGMNYPNSAGQTQPYLSGRKNIGDKTEDGKAYRAMPHKIVNGTITNSEYGDRPQVTRIAGNGNGGLNIDLTDETIDEIMSKPPAGPDNLFGGPNYPIAYNAVYNINAGPLNAKVIDPLNVISSQYLWWQDTLVRDTIRNITDRPEVQGDTVTKNVGFWYVQDLSSGEISKSDATTVEPYEQLFVDRGISIDASQPFYPGPIAYGKINDDGNLKTVYDIFANNNGLIEATIEYADSSRQWLSGIEDIDVPGDALDWIRSGSHTEDAATGSVANNDWNTTSSPPNPWDPGEVYEKMIGGTWAPYCLTAYSGIDDLNIGESVNQSSVGPAISSISKNATPLKDIASVDIVLTSDKSLWTRSPVLEMSYDASLAEGNANKFGLRAAASVDKDGNAATMGEGSSDNENDPNYISDHGMGWFPGYAINVETGERLNIMFGEDSFLAAQNGRDMLFNPPKRRLLADINDPEIVQKNDPNIFSGTFPNQIPVFGGKHYVYIVAHTSKSVSALGIDFNMPAYDAGRYAVSVLDTIFESVYITAVNQFFGTIMYAGMPMGVEGQEWLDNDVKIRIRVGKPYERGYASVPLDTVYEGLDINNFYPMYEFTMDGLEVERSNVTKFTSDLDEIRVVPNPYYAYASYENNALDNRVRITNLPEECTITIYDVSGVKIRQFTKASPETTLDWDLKNFANVPIAGGVYYMHVTTQNEEMVYKFFATMRVPDINTF